MQISREKVSLLDDMNEGMSTRESEEGLRHNTVKSFIYS